MNSNGDLTFLSALSTYSPAAFPYQQNTKIIAAYWGDVDTHNGGDIWYRETHDPVLLRRASTEIQSVFPEQSQFNANWIFISTWSNVAFYGADKRGKHKVRLKKIIYVIILNKQLILQWRCRVIQVL